MSALLGVVTTLAVAWGSACWTRFGASKQAVRRQDLGPLRWLVLLQSEPTGVRYTSTVVSDPPAHIPTDGRAKLPTWTDLSDPALLDKPDPDHYEVAEAHGWPRPALAFRFTGVGDPSDRAGVVVGGIGLSPSSTGVWYSPRALPCTPIWRNMLYDSGVFGGAWAVLLIVPSGLLAVSRRLLGRCPWCGRPFRSDHGAAAGCPECGWRRLRPDQI